MSRFTRIVAALGLVALVSGMAPHASAAGHPRFRPKAQRSLITVIAELIDAAQAKQTHKTNDRAAAAQSKANAVPVKRRIVPACHGNTPARGREICTAAIESCAARNIPDGYLAWEYFGLPSVDRPGSLTWTLIGTRCVRDREPADSSPPFVLSLRDFQRLPLPPGGLSVQPASGPVLINIPTNFYVDAKPVPLTATVLGTRVEIVATPVRYRWTFGDGGSLDTTDPGAPYPHMTTTHTYWHPAHPTVGLTTSYAGRYRVVGGDPTWLPVEGTADVSGPDITLDVVEARARLVP